MLTGGVYNQRQFQNFNTLKYYFDHLRIHRLLFSESPLTLKFNLTKEALIEPGKDQKQQEKPHITKKSQLQHDKKTITSTSRQKATS